MTNANGQDAGRIAMMLGMKQAAEAKRAAKFAKNYHAYRRHFLAMCKVRNEMIDMLADALVEEGMPTRAEAHELAQEFIHNDWAGPEMDCINSYVDAIIPQSL